MLNICGCLVHAAPAREGEISAVLARLDGVEVHAAERGRIVVTVEDTEALAASERIMAMHQIPGVLTVTLTYHHFEEPGDAPAASDLPTA